jgi:hypothetical protein
MVCYLGYTNNAHAHRLRLPPASPAHPFTLRLPVLSWDKQAPHNRQPGLFLFVKLAARPHLVSRASRAALCAPCALRPMRAALCAPCVLPQRPYACRELRSTQYSDAVYSLGAAVRVAGARGEPLAERVGRAQ